MGPIVDARARMSSPTRETTTTSDGDGRGTFTADDALEATLSEAVRENLEAHCVENAAFLAERLRAHRDSDANALLSAKCLYLLGRESAVCGLLGTRLTTPAARYLFAKACYDLGKLAEAESALRAETADGGRAFGGGYGSRRRPSAGEEEELACGGAAGEYLLGLICKETGRRAAAVARFTRALTADPLMWCAYEGLCALGADAEAKALASATRDESISAMYPSLAASGINLVSHKPPRVEASATRGRGLPPPSPPRTATRGGESAMSTPGIFSLREHAVHPSTGASDRTTAMGEGWDATDLQTPAVGDANRDGGADSVGGAFVTPSPSSIAGAPAPPQKVGGGRAPPTSVAQRATRASTAQQRSARDTGGTTTVARGLFGERRKFEDEGKLRKVSERLFSDDPASTAVRRSSRIQAARMQHVGASPDDDGAHLSRVPEDGEASYDTGHYDDHRDQGTWSWQPSFAARTAEGTVLAFKALRPLAEGLRHLAMYRCEDALRSFEQLTRAQYDTAYVLCAVAKAHAEMVDYPNAARYFEEARAADPHRLEGLDVYSTVLWHLKEEVKLSNLAQEVQGIDRLAPQTWCVLGNCFSLQKEHELALKFFQRAIQLDPKYTYAHTLSGHEYFANEDFEKSMNCYRAALRLDSRHYNAWYGLGTVYYRQEKYVMSEYHFRYALNINSKSSVLFCYAGMAKHALGENSDAMTLLSQAIALDEKNPLARYEMAAVLMSEENYDQALEELQTLQEIAPKEASVFFLMGRIYKKLGLQEKAMINFSIALDLRPSNADVNSIKSAIEKLDSDEVSDEEDI